MPGEDGEGGEGWQSFMASNIWAAVGEANIFPDTEQERKEGPTKPENIGSLSDIPISIFL